MTLPRRMYRLVGPDGETYESPTKGTLGGHRRSRIYGRLDCPGALRALARGGPYATYRVFFADEATAIAAGYRPCWVCMRSRYESWKHGLLRALAVGVALVAPGFAPAQSRVAFSTPDGARIQGDIYGKGNQAIVIIGHGGYSSRVTWKAEASALGAAGYRVLVFDTRAAVELASGKETACLYDDACMAVDVLAAARYLRRAGAKTVAVMGGSAGGGAAARASVDAAPGEIDKLVLLAPMTIATPDRIKGRALYVTSRDDLGSDHQPRLPGIREQFEKTPGPKEWLLVDGSAHGQRIFETADGPRVRRAILRFLAEP